MSAKLIWRNVSLQVAALEKDRTPLNLRAASPNPPPQQADSASDQGREARPKRPKWMGWGAPPSQQEGTPPNIKPQAGPDEEGQSSRAEGAHGYPDQESSFGRAKRPADDTFLETEKRKTKQGAEMPRDRLFQRWLERFGV